MGAIQVESTIKFSILRTTHYTITPLRTKNIPATQKNPSREQTKPSLNKCIATLSELSSQSMIIIQESSITVLVMFVRRRVRLQHVTRRVQVTLPDRAHARSSRKPRRSRTQLAVVLLQRVVPVATSQEARTGSVDRRDRARPLVQREQQLSHLHCDLEVRVVRIDQLAKATVRGEAGGRRNGAWCSREEDAPSFTSMLNTDEEHEQSDEK